MANGALVGSIPLPPLRLQLQTNKKKSPAPATGRAVYWMPPVDVARYSTAADTHDECSTKCRPAESATMSVLGSAAALCALCPCCSGCSCASTVGRAPQC
ncbi:hypothetical protein BS78_06G289700 [Paspalum vaginatum]|nr:hypothetical protein BS78_06G289700 [Paspalum vaginatum]